jgi:hypothetical protein
MAVWISPRVRLDVAMKSLPDLELYLGYSSLNCHVIIVAVVSVELDPRWALCPPLTILNYT